MDGQENALTDEQAEEIRKKWINKSGATSSFDIEEPQTVINALYNAYESEKSKALELENDIAMLRLRELGRMGKVYR